MSIRPSVCGLWKGSLKNNNEYYNTNIPFINRTLVRMFATLENMLPN